MQGLARLKYALAIEVFFESIKFIKLANLFDNKYYMFSWDIKYEAENCDCQLSGCNYCLEKSR